MDVLIDKWMDNYTHHKTHNTKKSYKESAVIFLEKHSPGCLHRLASKKIVIIS